MYGRSKREHSLNKIKVFQNNRGNAQIFDAIDGMSAFMRQFCFFQRLEKILILFLRELVLILWSENSHFIPITLRINKSRMLL